jgi:hypothetical protein
VAQKRTMLTIVTIALPVTLALITAMMQFSALPALPHIAEGVGNSSLILPGQWLRIP